MKTKDKGDILAERIESTLKKTSFTTHDIREALAEYRTRRPLPEVKKPILTPEQIAAGWVEWHGGECPVWGGSTPTVMFRDGSQYTTASAVGNNWTHDQCDGDIIAYLPDPYEAMKKAHSEGKVIQCFDDEAGASGEWFDLSGVVFWDCKPEAYRTKPLPLGPEDVPPGSVIRHSGWTYGGHVAPSVFLGGVCWANTNGNVFISYEELMYRNWQISRDGGKTWQKCQKEEK